MAEPFSMGGTPYSNGPGRYGDANDMARRNSAATLSDLILKNPALSRKFNGVRPSAGYLSSGVPYDNEGLLSAYALKYGQQKAMELLEAMPHMNTEDLLAVEKSLGQAGRESDSVNEREMNTYIRNDPNFWDKSRQNQTR